MVLIALLFACAAPKITPESVIAVQTVLVTPAVSETAAVSGLIERALAADNVQSTSVPTDAAWAALGTSGHRSAWLVQQSGGALTLLIEAEARRRATLVGRFQWEVEATVVVAKEALPELTQTKIMRVTLPHAHQDETDALTSAAPRIGQVAATLVRQFSGTDG